MGKKSANLPASMQITERLLRTTRLIKVPLLYTEMIRILGDSDTTTKRMLEGILANEEEHADELAGLIQKYDQAQTSPRRESTSAGAISCQLEQ